MKHRYYLVACAAVLGGIVSFSVAQDNRQAKMAELKAKLAPALSLSIEELQLALSIKVHERFDGASIIADDDESTFLGKISNEVASDSIFNDVGRYGSVVSSTSIWNQVGRFGGEVARHSPFNRVSSSPPLIVKDGKVIGRLTVNKVIRGAVDPNWLKTYYK
ncbi:MAG: hypothetical protein FJ386_09945 [Verrucomicrobia bacterium]|nr:hypothetical protein [Verrucomicrobiota bacterium]